MGLVHSASDSQPPQQRLLPWLQRSAPQATTSFAAAEAIAEYLGITGIMSGPLFRPRRNSRSEKLADRAFAPTTMYVLLSRYLARLPGAMKERVESDGAKKQIWVVS